MNPKFNILTRNTVKSTQSDWDWASTESVQTCLYRLVLLKSLIFYLSISSTGFPCPPRIVRPRGQQWHPYRLNWRINSFGSFFWRNILIFIIRPMLRTLIPPACLSLKIFFNFWNFLGPGPVRSQIFQFWLVLVRGFLIKTRISWTSEHFTFDTPRHTSHMTFEFWKFEILKKKMMNFFERELFRLNGLVLKPCYLNVPEQNGLRWWRHRTLYNMFH